VFLRALVVAVRDCSVEVLDEEWAVFGEIVGGERELLETGEFDVVSEPIPSLDKLISISVDPRGAFEEVV